MAPRSDSHFQIVLTYLTRFMGRKQTLTTVNTTPKTEVSFPNSERVTMVAQGLSRHFLVVLLAI